MSWFSENVLKRLHMGGDWQNEQAQRYASANPPPTSMTDQAMGGATMFGPSPVTSPVQTALPSYYLASTGGLTPPSMPGGMAAGGLGNVVYDPFSGQYVPTARSGDMTTKDWLGLGLQGAGLALGAYGSWKEGQARDKQVEEERRRYEQALEDRRRATEDLSPLVARYLSKVNG